MPAIKTEALLRPPLPRKGPGEKLVPGIHLCQEAWGLLWSLKLSQQVRDSMATSHCGCLRTPAQLEHLSYLENQIYPPKHTEIRMFSPSEILSLNVFPSLFPDPGSKIHSCQSSFKTTLTHKHMQTQSQPTATNTACLDT